MSLTHMPFSVRLTFCPPNDVAQRHLEIIFSRILREGESSGFHSFQSIDLPDQIRPAVDCLSQSSEVDVDHHAAADAQWVETV